jgi:hypothetical protein
MFPASCGSIAEKYVQKVVILTIIVSSENIHRPLYYLKPGPGEWALPPSSGTEL